jgi:hypothetical protein
VTPADLRAAGSCCAHQLARHLGILSARARGGSRPGKSPGSNTLMIRRLGLSIADRLDRLDRTGCRVTFAMEKIGNRGRLNKLDATVPNHEQRQRYFAAERVVKKPTEIAAKKRWALVNHRIDFCERASRRCSSLRPSRCRACRDGRRHHAEMR